nr:hypothetical protein [uncultured Shimia sp.]
MRWLTYLAGCLLPMAAQAIVVTPYHGMSLQCQSTEICQTNGDCTAHTQTKARLDLEAATYASSFAPFAPSREKWARRMTVSWTSSDAAPLETTYRDIPNAFGARDVWKFATSQERHSGWFGPELPAENLSQDQWALPPFQIWHTRTRPTDTPKLFKAKDRDIIVFTCTEVTQ